MSSQDELGSALARSIVEQVARDAVKTLFTRNYGSIEVHGDAYTEAEFEQDVVDVLLGDDTGCLNPDEVSDENCTVLIVDKLLAGAHAEEKEMAGERRRLLTTVHGLIVKFIVRYT